MTTRAPESTPTTVPNVAASSARLAALPRLDFQAAREWTKHEWHWLLVGAAYLLAWWEPAALCWWENWRFPHSPLSFAMVVPLLMAVILWSRREELQTAYRRSQANKRGFWVKGNLVPLAVGCVFLLAGNLSQVKGLSVLGLVLIAVGIVYQTYGAVVLKAASPAFLYMLVMVPPPDSIVNGLNLAVFGRSVSTAAKLLGLAGIKATDIGSRLRLENTQTLVDYTLSNSAVAVAIPATALLLGILIARRARPATVICLLILSALISLFACAVRVLTIALLTPTQPGLANALNQAPAWPVTVIVIGLTLGIAALAVRNQGRLPAPIQRFAVGVGQGANAVTNPLLKGLGVLGSVGRLWKLSERGIEKMLSGGGKSKRKRRGGW